MANMIYKYRDLVMITRSFTINIPMFTPMEPTSKLIGSTAEVLHTDNGMVQIQTHSFIRGHIGADRNHWIDEDIFWVYPDCIEPIL